jgi:hypothetical protein
MFSAKKARGIGSGRLVANVFHVCVRGREAVRMDALILDTATGKWGGIEIEPQEGKIAGELVLEKIGALLGIPVTSVYLKVEGSRDGGSVLTYKYQLTAENVDALRSNPRVRFVTERPDPRFEWNPDESILGFN